MTSAHTRGPSEGSTDDEHYLQPDIPLLRAETFPGGRPGRHASPPPSLSQTPLLSQGEDNDQTPFNAQSVSQAFAASNARDAAGSHVTDAWEPIPPPPDREQLTYLPFSLKATCTILAAIWHGVLAIVLIFMAIYPHATTPYSIHSDNYYLSVRFGPGLIASTSIFVYKAISLEFLHMLPYINMASKNPEAQWAEYTVLAHYWPVMYSPNTLATWLHYIMIPLGTGLIAYKALLIEVVSVGTSWQMYIHPIIAVPLIIYYTLMALYFTWMTCWLWNRSTGLRPGWAPRTLVDIASLLADSDDLIEPDEISYANKKFLPPTIPDELLCARYRLGYWRRSRRNSAADDVHGPNNDDRHPDDDDDISYGIRRLRDVYKTDGRRKRIRELRHRAALKNEEKVKEESRRAGSPYIFSLLPVYRYWLYAGIIVAGGATIVWLGAAGYVRDGFAISDNFTLHKLDTVMADLQNQTDKGNITLVFHGPLSYMDTGKPTDRRMLHILVANTVFRSLPLVLLAQVPFGLATLDPLYRFMQPLYNMSQKSCHADESILMEYITKSAFDVIPDAFAHGYWKVVLFALLGSCPEFLMLLPYGMLSLAGIGDYIVGVFSIFAITGTGVLLVIYAILLLSTWPTVDRRLIRSGMSIMDIWILFRGSKILKDSKLISCRPGWTKQRLHAHVVVQHKKYALGEVKSPDPQIRQ
ncbi:hypothetical protein AMS68_003388 [Peltaster fructicola]|uniref:Uncharacterized protein n=1 Tax=Peltaster fructicola TaxID=286661 RepID=A0A6H0XT79_9PEZI|nr:hypothetical protein AMS68_003388 [Peltaster fructicola]